ncbi:MULTISPECIES: SCO family protein [unclassified Sphingomonas]|uniref:SCO family protein n=1 Tax=unclassified Sphingomonas TaxID=196159 RepID=UPI0006FFA626|nr:MULTISPECIES: SCO family protein [unclassified Sphingomonas]KQM62414.1 electron transporter [Sphingomonas sp. Leaf16]KQN13839.1 electron transporter [Sphingomonas sp. Leaf29]KQN23906.1 electron transporter [Sphingomonas sp. Leaf32]
MAGNTMNSILRPLAPALALALAACGSAPEPAPTAPLAGARIGGPFVLTDGQGRVVRDTDFAGKWRIMYFGYTYCPDVCPVDVQNIAAGVKAFEAEEPELGAKVVPIFITVDPERDTPAVVGKFVSAFHPRMVGLTGSAQAIADAARAYGVTYAKQQSPGATEYLMDHSRTAILMNPRGQPVALLPQEESGEAVAAELKKWVR